MQYKSIAKKTANTANMLKCGVSSSHYIKRMVQESVSQSLNIIPSFAVGGEGGVAFIHFIIIIFMLNASLSSVRSSSLALPFEMKNVKK